ncbi:hypothetical protein Mlute_00501 [Meiothermus luteus]|uniref:Uncharacterized protein n=1 Tax=Meiothermus luteus TaxID=2026184 RepID=A0A399EWG7_9DEIN|nr:hypothetical protein [Meiothermus luteus]RIH88894.1 hypothetical protein Mlute_00501 [Meiothermus luteus]RMH53897.1 MAG: hypothetical protein D6684_11060 [Deinococcota bacterium]
MENEKLPPLLNLSQLREVLGPQLVGRDAAYRLMRKYGIRLGRGYVLPRTVLEALLSGGLGNRQESDAS